MRRVLRLRYIAIATTLLLFTTVAADAQLDRSATHLRFRENRGQVIDTRGDRRPDILYTAGDGPMRVYLRRDAISYLFMRWSGDSLPPRSDVAEGLSKRPGLRRGHLESYRVDMQLIGANPHAAVVAEEPSGDYANYYLGHCPDDITHVPAYGRVTYRDIYPGIDLVLYTSGDHLKYDFIVHPGGRVEHIASRFSVAW